MLIDIIRARFSSVGLVAASILISCSAGGDVLRLKDGNILRGSLVAADSKAVRFRTAAGIGIYSRGGVVSIALGDPTPAPKKIIVEKPAPAKKVAAVPTLPAESNAAVRSATLDAKSEQTSEEPVETGDALAPFRKSGLIPEKARPNDPVLERDLCAMIGLITKSFSKEVDNPITPEKPSAPVSRARALTAIVKISALPSDVDERKSPAASQMPPDNATIPGWARPYVCIAVEQTWWPVEKTFNANGVATWQFIAAIIEHTPYSDIGPLPAKPVASSDPDAYTGLIVDARDLPLQRSMSVRVLSKSGEVLYPHPDHIPDIGYVQDHGMADYIMDGVNPKRSGKKPLEVAAIDVSSGGNDVVVSEETADQIREANRSGKFLWRWAVSILVK